MGRTLVARYQDAETARSVVAALLEAGFSGDDISLLINDTSLDNQESSHPNISVGECAAVGAFVGALVGIGSAVMPEIEPVLGATPLAILATALVGAVVGALTGGITAGLIDIEPDESKNSTAAAWLRADGTIVSLTTNEQWLEWAERIMMRYQPLRIEGREATWYGGARANFNLDTAGESGKFAPLSPGSSTNMRQINPVPSLHRRAKSYEYHN